MQKYWVLTEELNSATYSTRMRNPNLTHENTWPPEFPEFAPRALTAFKGEFTNTLDNTNIAFKLCVRQKSWSLLSRGHKVVALRKNSNDWNGFVPPLQVLFSDPLCLILAGMDRLCTARHLSVCAFVNASKRTRGPGRRDLQRPLRHCHQSLSILRMRMRTLEMRLGT